MSDAYTLVTPPEWEPVSVEEVRQHLRITTTTEDEQILPWIKAARQVVENFTQNKLITQTWDWKIDHFYKRYPSRVLSIPFNPVQEVSSISYIDTAGSTQTLATSLYQVDTDSEPGRIMPSFGNVWPITRSFTFHTITVRLVLGFGLPIDVPKELRLALLMIAGDFYNHREDSLIMQTYQPPNAARSLMHDYKLQYF